MADHGQPDGLNPELLTWSALLSQSVRLAQAAVALPEGTDAAGREGSAWRASVPHVISLQALWLALQRRDEMPETQRALGRDRAAVALDRDRAALRAAWAQAERPMPEGVLSLIAEVEALLA